MFDLSFESMSLSLSGGDSHTPCDVMCLFFHRLASHSTLNGDQTHRWRNPSKRVPTTTVTMVEPDVDPEAGKYEVNGEWKSWLEGKTLW
jgi:hypothetical protein